MLAILFPGQGSQARGMGAELFDEFPERVKEADAILGYSIRALCLEDPHQHLNQTQYTQPAIFTVNALSYFKMQRDLPSRPDFVAGHSLGEYNALLAAGVYDFQTGLQLVKKRGELMSRAFGGAMAAVVGMKLADVQQVLQQNDLAAVAIANYNSYTQIVISGLVVDIERAKIVLKEKANATVIALNVSGAFHSAEMVAAEQQFADYLQQFTFSRPALPVLANIDAKPYHPRVTKNNLAAQITHAVQWLPTMAYLLSHEHMRLEEVGPGQVLTGLIRRIKAGQ
jgi:malonyl CoA-acyl carrier protein transacylase